MDGDETRKRTAETSESQNVSKKSKMAPEMIRETYAELVEQIEIIRGKMRILEKERLDEMLSNSVIQGKIFSYLAPADIKSLATVSSTWRVMMEQPRFWTWATVRLSLDNFTERSQSVRIRSITNVLMEYDVSELQQRSFFSSVFYEVGAMANMRNLDISGTDLSFVSPEVLSEVIVKMKVVNLFDSNLTSEQLDTILIRIMKSSDDLNLSSLRTSLTSFSSVPPAILSKALVRLEKVDLANPELTKDQVAAILVEVGESKNLRLKSLPLSHIDLSRVPPQVFAKAVVRLERVTLRFTKLTTEHVEAALVQISTSQDLRLKSLAVPNVDLSPVEPEILVRAVLRLEGVKLLTATARQVEAILTEIIENRKNKFRWIRLPWSLVSAELISKALVNLESVDLDEVDLLPDQKITFFKEILKTPVMKLKNLKSYFDIGTPSFIRAIVRVENVNLITRHHPLAELKSVFLGIRNSLELKLKTLRLCKSDINLMKNNCPVLFSEVSSMVKIIDTH